MSIFDWNKVRVPGNSSLVTEDGLSPGTYLLRLDINATDKEIMFADLSGNIVLTKSAKTFAAGTKKKGSEIMKALPDSSIASKIAELLGRYSDSGSAGIVNHHVIPHRLWKECEFLKKVFDAFIFQARSGEYKTLKDHGLNMMKVPEWFHLPQHGQDDAPSAYTRMIRDIVDQRWDEMKDDGFADDYDMIVDELYTLITFLREEIEWMIQNRLTIREFGNSDISRY